MKTSGKRQFAIMLMFGVLVSLGACNAENHGTVTPTSTPSMSVTLPSRPIVEFLHTPLENDVSLHTTKLEFGCDGIYALDKDIVFLFCAIGASADGLSWSSLLRSTDGGQHWTEAVDRVRGSSVVEMDFIENGIGWALVMWTTEDPGDLTLFQTNDDGKTWQKVSAVPKSSYVGYPISMSFSDKLHGQIEMDYYGAAPGTDRVAYLRTRDGGLTWNESASMPWSDFMPDNHNKSEFYDAISAYLNKHRRDYSQWIGQDGSLWRLDRTGFPLSRIKRRLETGDWIAMSVLPCDLSYHDSQLYVP